jgi:hypothetical protein
MEHFTSVHQESKTERRRYQRFNIDNYDITGKILFAKHVRIINISVGGVLLKTDRNLNINKTYLLRMEDPDQILPVMGTVLRSDFSKNYKTPLGDIIPVYAAGMQFTDISREKIDEITDFIMLAIHYHRTNSFARVH